MEQLSRFMFLVKAAAIEATVTDWSKNLCVVICLKAYDTYELWDTQPQKFIDVNVKNLTTRQLRYHVENRLTKQQRQQLISELNLPPGRQKWETLYNLTMW